MSNNLRTICAFLAAALCFPALAPAQRTVANELNGSHESKGSGGRKWTFEAVLGTTLTADSRTGQVNFGILGPSPDESPQSIQWQSGPRRPVIGGGLEYELDQDTSILGNMIYRQLTETEEYSYANRTAHSRTFTDHSFEVPVTIIREIDWPLEPSFGIGGAVRMLDGYDPLFSGITSLFRITFRSRVISISPQIRYTRWFVNTGLPTKRDQLQLLVSIPF